MIVALLFAIFFDVAEGAFNCGNIADVYYSPKSSDYYFHYNSTVDAKGLTVHQLFCQCHIGVVCAVRLYNDSSYRHQLAVLRGEVPVHLQCLADGSTWTSVNNGNTYNIGSISCGPGPATTGAFNCGNIADVYYSPMSPDYYFHYTSTVDARGLAVHHLFCQCHIGVDCVIHLYSDSSYRHQFAVLRGEVPIQLRCLVGGSTWRAVNNGNTYNIGSISCGPGPTSTVVTTTPKPALSPQEPTVPAPKMSASRSKASGTEAKRSKSDPEVGASQHKPISLKVESAASMDKKTSQSLERPKPPCCSSERLPPHPDRGHGHPDFQS